MLAREGSSDCFKAARSPRLARERGEALAMNVSDAIEVKESVQVGLLNAYPVEFDAADLGGGPAEAVGYLITRETGALAKPAQFGGEPTATDGRAAIIGQPSGSPRSQASIPS